MPLIGGGGCNVRGARVCVYVRVCACGEIRLRVSVRYQHAFLSFRIPTLPHCTKHASKNRSWGDPETNSLERVSVQIDEPLERQRGHTHCGRLILQYTTCILILAHAPFELPSTTDRAYSHIPLLPSSPVSPSFSPSPTPTSAVHAHVHQLVRGNLHRAPPLQRRKRTVTESSLGDTPDRRRSLSRGQLDPHPR